MGTTMGTVTTKRLDSPFGTQPLQEILLSQAPLVRVIAQVRFPKILSLSTEAGIADIQTALRKQYPILHQDKTVGVIITPDGVTSGSQQSDVVWRFQSKNSDWTVSLNSSFVAIDTKSYSSRNDFCDRFEEILRTVSDLVEPVVAERVGLRYTNRLEDPEQLASLNSLVRSEILGGSAIKLPESVQLKLSLSESLFNFGTGQLLARWGVLPEGGMIDPGIDPVDRPSWILDLDVFHAEQIDFSPEELTSTVRLFADMAYRFFRWTVTDEFLKQAGGQL